jgi:hypothetical protein
MKRCRSKLIETRSLQQSASKESATAESRKSSAAPIGRAIAAWMTARRDHRRGQSRNFNGYERPA